MRLNINVVLLFIGLFLVGGCAKYSVITYDQLERTNRVEVKLVSGKRELGTITKTEPHQITLLKKDRALKMIAKSSIRTIKRKTPVYDDFGRGISEEEIESVKTNKNTLIYGIGGGTLSFGVSFFVGSLFAGQENENGGAIIAGSTIGGG